MPTSSKTTLLALGYGQEWELHKRRTRRLLLVGLAAHVLTATAAVLAWASIVTRELPVITLRPTDTPVCAPSPAPGRNAWSTIQVEAWVTALVKAAMVQDSTRVQENLQTLTTMLAPSLRAAFRRTESMRARFAEAAKLNIRGTLTEWTIDCGEDPQFIRSNAPWYCIAYGGAEYGPAVGARPKGVPAVTSYFFVELAIRPGVIAPANPLGLEAIEFLPREAETKTELQKLVTEEKL